MSCPVCQADVTPAEPTGPEPTIVRCSGCGTGVTVPPPGRDVASDGLFTDGSYAGARLEQREQWLEEARARVRWVSGWLRAGSSILELGSATGEFLEQAERAGYEACGVEPSRWAVDNTPAGLEVFEGTLADWLRVHPDRTVDGVAAFHVLEHVPDPLRFLRDIGRVLRPEGRVFLEVPNWGARDAREQGTAWNLALPEDHVVHFTPASLRRCLEQAGMRTLGQSEETWSLYASGLQWWLIRLQWLRAGHLRPSHDLLRVVAGPTRATAGGEPSLPSPRAAR